MLPAAHVENDLGTYHVGVVHPDQLHAKPLESNGLEHALTLARTLRELPFELNLWQAQNIWNDLYSRRNKNYWPPEWKLAFKKLGEALYISVDELVIDEGVTVF